MADGSFAGGGSVIWTITTDEMKSPGDLSIANSLERGIWTERGTDHKAVYGQDFVIRILPPKGVTPEQFIRKFAELARATKDGRVEFAIPIEDQRNQVQVAWGKIPEVGEGPFRRTAV